MAQPADRFVHGKDGLSQSVKVAGNVRLCPLESGKLVKSADQLLEELVAPGRYPYTGRLGVLSEEKTYAAVYGGDETPYGKENMAGPDQKPAISIG